MHFALRDARLFLEGSIYAELGGGDAEKRVALLHLLPKTPGFCPPPPSTLRALLVPLSGALRSLAFPSFRSASASQ